ncbi:MAG: DNA alkylation repair protein [Clostridium sp.]
MNDIILDAKEHFKGLSKENGLTTGKVRSFSSKLYKHLDDKSISNVFNICEELLNEGKWELGIIAYDWAYRVRSQYNEDTFFIFENWLKKYVTGWGDCDDFCTHAFGELLSQNNDLFNYVITWTKHPDFFVRRAAAVILIYPINKSKYDRINPYVISDMLMKDEHHLVLKGYGWMLKVLSQAEPDKVYEYLLKNKDIMPRVAFRYALEKFDDNVRRNLMTL